MCSKTLAVVLLLLSGAASAADDVAETRAVVPDEVAIKAAEGEIRALFKDDFAKAKKPADKVALAEKFLAMAGQSEVDVERYALLSEVQTLAVAAARPALVMQAVSALAEYFAINRLAAMTAALEECSNKEWPAAARKELVSEVVPLVDEAIAAGEFNLARRQAALGLALAGKTNQSAEAKKFSVQAKESAALEKLVLDAKVARKKLADTPDDPESHLMLGKYLCLIVGKWDKGLPHLRQGSDAALRDVAQLESEVSESAADQIKLGDLWWELAAQEKEFIKGRFRARSKFWYEQALGGATGLSKTKVEKRLDELASLKVPTIGLGGFTGRQMGSRTALLTKYGGNATTEGAVDRGLDWLAKQQKPDGLWSLTGPYADGATEENAVSVTAMALLAFQGRGETHRTGQHSKIVKRGWDALLKKQAKDGDFVGNSSIHQKMYTQAQCTLALCELYGMTGDVLYRAPAELAVKFAVKSQDLQGGGWRYVPGMDSDTSMTGWFVMALQSARMAKLDVPQETFDRVSRYLDAVALADGKYSYTPGTFSTPAVTAEGYLCRQALGWKQNDQRLIAGVGALNRNRVNYKAPDRDVYYWYHATQACHHMEGEIWTEWNSVMMQEVPGHQVKNGPQAGSWDPAGDKWGVTGGRLYVTCLSICMLEVYYRHLPLYSDQRPSSGTR